MDGEWGGDVLDVVGVLVEVNWRVYKINKNIKTAPRNCLIKSY